MEFRSKEAASGYFRKLGRIHAHIDAGGSHLFEKVDQIVRKLDSKAFVSKCNQILASFPSSHREHQDFLLTYANHTPGTKQGHQFDVFSTTAFESSKQAAETVKYILHQFADTEGVVVEVERVLAVIGNGAGWKKPLPLIRSIDESQVGYGSLFTHPLEIHLAFDLPKAKYSRNNSPSISPQDVFKKTDPCGLKVGEWFLFDKGTHWSFRSSQFLEIDGFEEIARDYHTLLQECLKDMFEEEVKSWTLIEQILGLWKTRVSQSIKYGKGKKGSVQLFGPELTLPQLGRWEQSFPTLKHFWGIAPNFLGDTNPDIHDAMLFNLRERGTIYTYFLHSFADLQRLRDFTTRLERELGRGDLSEQIKPVLLWDRPGEKASEGSIRNELFIANPLLKERKEGYRIIRNSNGSVTRGLRLSKNECEKAVALLRPLLDRPVQGIRPPALHKGEEIGLAIAYTDLEDSVKTMHETPASTWDQMLETYDRLVATEASKVGGDVIKALGDGYLLSFTTPRAAFDFAIRIQKALDHYNAHMETHNPEARVPKQRMALDYGQVRRVERSHGYDLSGVALSRCARVVAQAKTGNHILMTKQFRDQLADSLAGPGRLGETIRFIGTVQIKGFENSVDVFELVWRNRNGVAIEALKPEELTGTPPTVSN
jgi:class 3 adenylate cyclase